MKLRYQIFFYFLIPLCTPCSLLSSTTKPYYQGIQKILNRYERTFTLLDTSENGGYYSFQIAKMYDSVCVIAEAGEAILNSCKENHQLNNIILLNTHFPYEKLKHLSECEHFDVILAGSIRTNYNEQWKSALEALLDAGDFLIIEGAPDDNELKNYLLSKGGEIIEYDDPALKSNTILYLLRGSNKYLRRKTWLRLLLPKNIYRIESSYKEKYLTKPASWLDGSSVTTTWIPGINLCTFKMCYGAYPTTDNLLSSLSLIKDNNHSDWMINNMVIQGKRLALIDYDDKQSERFVSQELYLSHKMILSLPEPQKVEHYFWYNLTKVPVNTKKYLKLFSRLFPSANLVLDFGKPDELLTTSYQKYGVKIVQFPIADNRAISLDELIGQYATPVFCNLRVEPAHSYSMLQTLSKEADCIAFRFSMKCTTELVNCLKLLSSLGYKQFNFSSRNIPSLVLADNRYRAIKRDWAKSMEELIDEIQKFQKLDHDDENLWGYIYVRKNPY